MAKDTQSRKWQITINNPAAHGLNHDALKVLLLDFRSLTYWCMCDEVGEEGTYHTCLYVHGSNGVRFSTLTKAFSGKAHLEMARGTAQQNRDYIRKEGKWEKTKKKNTNLPETFEEWGELPDEHQGRRTDVLWLWDQLKEGRSDIDILNDNPRFLFNLDKIERARQRFTEEKYRRQRRLDLRVEYIHGSTGVGKTCSIMDLYGDENVYRVTDYLHPFDQYRGEDVIVFEEFRSSLPIEAMLVYLDVYSVQLPCRYANKQACYTKAYIVTNIPLSRQYPNIQLSSPETWAAFKRRIHHVFELLPGVVVPGSQSLLQKESASAF